MGSWGTGILENDVAMDLHDFFEDLCNLQELDIEDIKAKTIVEFELLDVNGQPNFGFDEWLAYAKKCWEYGALDEMALKTVSSILDHQEEIRGEWEALWEKRIEVIQKFIGKIQTPTKRKKGIQKPHIVQVSFEVGDCVAVKSSDGTNFSVEILLEIERVHENQNLQSYFWATTRIFGPIRPTLDDVKRSHLLMLNYGKTMEGSDAGWGKTPQLSVFGAVVGIVKSEKKKLEMDRVLSQYDVIGNLKLKSKPRFPKSYGRFELDNSFQLLNQLGWEKQHPQARDLSFPIAKYIEGEQRPRKSWKFWRW